MDKYTQEEIALLQDLCDAEVRRLLAADSDKYREVRALSDKLAFELIPF